MLIPFLLQLPLPSLHRISSSLVIKISSIKFSSAIKSGILISSSNKSTTLPFLGDFLLLITLLGFSVVTIYFSTAIGCTSITLLYLTNSLSLLPIALKFLVCISINESSLTKSIIYLSTFTSNLSPGTAYHCLMDECKDFSFFIFIPVCSKIKTVSSISPIFSPCALTNI